MFQIIGVRQNDQRFIIATPKTAGEALNHFRTARTHFASVLIVAADGREIDSVELNRLYQAEQLSSYE